MLARMAVVILALTFMGMLSVKLRRDEAVGLHEAQCLSRRLAEQRRKLWELEYHLSVLTSPDAVALRAQEMGVELAPPHERGIHERPGVMLAMEQRP